MSKCPLVILQINMCEACAALKKYTGYCAHCTEQPEHTNVLFMSAGNLDNAAYLANVCVAESARRQGIGGALIQAARQHARDWGEQLHLLLPVINAI